MASSPATLRPPTCRLVTFGCKVNQYDSQAIREDLLGRGWREAPANAPADVTVVDTCTVTETAAREALRRIRQITRTPGARVVVTGCLVPSHRETLESIPGVVMLAPTEAKSRLGDALDQLARPTRPAVSAPADRRPAVANTESPAPRWLEGDPASSFRHGISRFDGRTRAFVKVQDGCNLACAYCIVPKVRGRSRSRATEDAVEETRRLVGSGYQELVLTGVHLGAYGADLPGRGRLFDLVARLLGVPGRWRLRLSSLEANELRTEDLAAFSDFCTDGAGGTRARLCPHLHLPLQSGSADVLRRMRRAYAPEAYAETVAALRARIPDVAITTDLLVGFPGETDRDFTATLDAASRLAFSRVHAFPYSPRPGTEAAGMPGAVPPAEVKARMRALAGVARASAAAFHRRFVGRTVEVLAEERPDRRTGRPCGYSGEYLRVILDPSAPRGGLVEARVTGADGDGATAETAPRVPRAVSYAV